MNRRGFIGATIGACPILGDDKPFEVTIQRISLDDWRVWRLEKGRLIVDACHTLGDALAVAGRVLVQDVA